MSEERTKVGGDVDAWCTRCKLDLAHTVVAMVGRNVVQVICNTCGSHHRYRAPKSEPAPRGPAVGKVRRKRGDTVVERTTVRTPTASRPKAVSVETVAAPSAATPRKRASSAPARQAANWERTWNEQLQAAGDAEPRPYRMADCYAKGEALQHARFGVGLVQQVTAATKVVVLFRTGLRTLVMNTA